MDGYNVCIFAYGQTGSGKTHTMEGTDSDRGITFRALSALFREAQSEWAGYAYEFEVRLEDVQVEHTHIGLAPCVESTRLCFQGTQHRVDPRVLKAHACVFFNLSKSTVLSMGGNQVLGPPSIYWVHPPPPSTPPPLEGGFTP